VGGCTSPSATVLPQPIVVGLSSDGGALISPATVDGVSTPFPVVIDTGTPLTAYDDGTGQLRARLGRFRLFTDETPPVPRLELDHVLLFITPLGSVGVGTGVPVGGVLGGGNLESWALSLDYRAPPQVTFTAAISACSCALADDCLAVFPFSLTGGGSDRPVAVGSDLYVYPPTRVVLDACLEPLADPVSADVPCATDLASNPPPTRYRYLPSGVEVKVLVATGFPGLAIGDHAFDRLRGTGAAAAARAANPATLHLPDLADDGADHAGLTVGLASLGGAAVSSLALVSHELYFGPCAELARSRRQRRSPPGMPLQGEAACLQTPAQYPFNQCSGVADPASACDDSSESAHTAAIVELTAQVPVMVMSDDAPLLQGINADVRPSGATVEMVLGTEVLSRLVSTVDYPGSRFIARCASDDGCLTYPRYIHASQQSSCDALCVSPSAIPTAPTGVMLANRGGLCPAAPPR
jgi:hypothetical protein